MLYGRNNFINILVILIIFSFSIQVDSLKEDQLVKNYIKKGENQSYEILFNYERTEKKLLIDIMQFSGDILINLNETNSNIHRYQMANKILYIINLFERTLHNLTISIYGQKNSYYSLMYYYNKYYQEFNITKNINYLIQLDPYNEKGDSETRFIKFNLEGESVMFNFYSMNCLSKIDKMSILEEDKIFLKSKDDYFWQKSFSFINETFPGKFLIKFDDLEQDIYSNRMCAVFTSSALVGDEPFNSDQQILVGENIPQRIIFNSQVKNVKYKYQITDIYNDIALKFVVNDKGIYKVKCFIESKKNPYDKNPKKESIIYSDQVEILENSVYNPYCNENEECGLIVEIILLNENTDINLELEVRIMPLIANEIKPIYLQKNNINTDYLIGNEPNYYYTDLGVGVFGEINVNFYFGACQIIGKIIKQSDAENRNLSELFEFSSDDDGSLTYDNYLKKLTFDSINTKYCEYGCYLLLKVINNSDNNKYNSNNGNLKYFRLDLIITSNSPFMPLVPPIVYIPMDKYFRGSITKSSNSYQTMFYIISPPNHADKIVFELQSENSDMYINLYLKENILYKNYKYPYDISHWHFSPSAKTSLFEITSSEVLNRDNNIYSLGEVCFTIAIKPKVPMIDLNSIYTFRYYLEYNISYSNFTIHEVYNNQEVICKTQVIDDTNKNKCLYIIKYYNLGGDNYLLIHPILEDKALNYHMYAYFIEKEKYNKDDHEELRTLIPNNDSIFSTNKTKEGFLYINLDKGNNKYLYLSIETENSTFIKLLSLITSLNSLNTELNPYTNQLFLIKNEKKFTFNVHEGFAIKIESIFGMADIFWQDKNFVHKLKRRDNDFLMISSSVNTNNTVYIQSNNEGYNSIEESNMPKGFIFDTFFYLRHGHINFDEVEYGKSFYLNYREVNPPFYLYMKLENTKKNINIFITLDQIMDDNRILNDKKEFDIQASFLGDNSIINIKNDIDNELQQNIYIPGIYDPSKRVLLVSLNSTLIDLLKMNIYPTPELNESIDLLLQIISNDNSNNNNNNKDSKFHSLLISGILFHDNSSIPIPEKEYMFGKLMVGSKDVLFKLKTDYDNYIMYIFFSSNSDQLDFEIVLDNGSIDKEITIEFNNNKIYSNGKNITFFNSKPENNEYIYLRIFKKNNEKVLNSNITNYAFKYINTDDSANIFFFEVSNPDITHTIQESSYLITFEEVKCDNCLVTYFVNFILRDSLNENEKFENIAVIQSPGMTKEFESNITDKKNGKIISKKLEVSSEKDFAFIQLIARVDKDPIKEYIAYKSHYLEPTSKDNGGSKEDNTNLIIIISVISGLFIIIVTTLVIIVYRFNKKNKDLLNKVNATSFQSDNLASYDQEDENNRNLLIN